jgi:hypothetical protein
MATHVLLHLHLKESFQLWRPDTGDKQGQMDLLRQERGFVHGEDGVCVLTREGLRGVRGLAAALLLELLALACLYSVWIAWRSLR